MQTIYLDHNATTPTRPEVLEAIARCHAAGYANPASQHQPGQHARRILEDARQRIAEVLGGNPGNLEPDRLIFTSSGTEANNLAILGTPIRQRRQRRRRGSESGADSDRDGDSGGQIVISAIEHASVIEPAEHLLERGFRLDTLGVTGDGVVRVEQLAPLLGPPTRLVSVMLGNHETGVLQPVAELAAMCNRAGVPLHSDAVAVAGKLRIDFRRLGVAAMSVAAHKFQGPLGIAALLVRHGVVCDRSCSAAISKTACGRARNRSPWPSAWPRPWSFGARARRPDAEADRPARSVGGGLEDRLPRGDLPWQAATRLPHTTNVAFPGLDGQVLLVALDMAGVACSVGSACASGSSELSPTLRAMQLSNEWVRGSIRLSVGATTSGSDIDEAVRRIVHVCRELRG